MLSEVRLIEDLDVHDLRLLARIEGSEGEPRRELPPGSWQKQVYEDEYQRACAKREVPAHG